MLISLLLIAAVGFLAFSNGANDNFKGVAALYGSGVAGYGQSLAWATIATGAGSLCAILFAQALLHRFTGKGLIPDALVASQPFVLAVALAAAATVMLATRVGFPISTTHALLGAMGGAGAVSSGIGLVRLAALGQGFLAPLLLSPILAIVMGGMIHFVLQRWFDQPQGAAPSCVCLGAAPVLGAAAQPGAAVAALGASRPVLFGQAGSVEDCRAANPGVIAGADSRGVMIGLHWMSAGAVSFARGLNDTPKIAALLLVMHALWPSWDIAVVTGAIGIGGVIAARRVAETLSHKITSLGRAEGLASNLSTAGLVLAASGFGLPVSTTHVSVGSLFGVGLTTGKADHRMIRDIVLSWLITLPCAAGFGALAVLTFGAWSA